MKYFEKGEKLNNGFQDSRILDQRTSDINKNGIEELVTSKNREIKDFWRRGNVKKIKI